MERIALPVQTLFAELVERAHAHQLQTEFDVAGRFITRSLNGREYWYFRSAMKAGERTDKYVGPDSEELRRLIKNHETARDDYKQRRQLVTALERTGIKGPDARTGRILEALANAGIFRMRAVVVGTTAYQTYAGLVGAKLAASNAITEDLDLAQFKTISVAVDDEVDVPLLEILQTVDPEFRPVPDTFSPGRNSHYAVGTGYRVDVLTPNRGPDDDALVTLPSIRSDAQPLRFLDFLIFQEVRSVALWGPGIPINVPAPERYALHKLMVSRLRLATKESQTKAQKDLRQAVELIRALMPTRPYELKDLWAELNDRGPRWRQLANEALSLVDAQLGDPDFANEFRQMVEPSGNTYG
ncbi:nucleotidyltransferase family protein [Devosia aurantiaca]|uniref:nucleotidyltransferase family protein n=1 Tax=Devosia aurantiaca TaxID=2714858 RepID=UPI002E2B7CC2|nr:GSU2403 family nucleotidyltransferase fold protein [Devosia aurantiaca]